MVARNPNYTVYDGYGFDDNDDAFEN